MIKDLVEHSAAGGLKLHMGKTKVMSNDPSNLGGTLKLDAGVIEIMKYSGFTSYLGKALSLHELHNTEIDARIDKAWKKFYALKADLCGRHASLTSRLRLFEATVTPTLLYGSGSWTMTADRERLLQTTQRRMLRWMLGSFWRRPCEDKKEADDGSDASSEVAELEDNEDEKQQKSDQESWVDWIV
eukprot:8097478-Karenia_brevis.AAC.1